jgi:hypothetical protein
MNDVRAKFALSASWLVLSFAILKFIGSFDQAAPVGLNAHDLLIGCSIQVLGTLVMVRLIRNVRKQPPVMDDLDISLAVLAISLSAATVVIAM